MHPNQDQRVIQLDLVLQKFYYEGLPAWTALLGIAEPLVRDWYMDCALLRSGLVPTLTVRDGENSLTLSLRQDEIEDGHCGRVEWRDLSPHIFVTPACLESWQLAFLRYYLAGKDAAPAIQAEFLPIDPERGTRLSLGIFAPPPAVSG